MARSIAQVLTHSGLSGMLLILGGETWTGMWLPLRGRQEDIRDLRSSNSGAAVVRALVANR
ncbi:hypothetical protein [Tropicimonas sp. IMCC6043]|uniref:hypothetical protein n=1 Tax=Tropicimonas sp. IMCC6043 TaxID=2510645 RepID=UPI00101D6DF7|nr:hypothetical protein [Tropicimonas sp. IMCC6043]RYH10970.1 hypothetical protein EU800_06900 [Tropicimonas sp. IMCC6043]